MFEKYLKLIKDHQDNKQDIKSFLNSLGLNSVTFNINGDVIDFYIPSAFKLKIYSKKGEILEFLKSKNLKPKNL